MTDARRRRAAAAAMLVRPLRPALVLVVVLTVATGVAYPLAMLGLGTLLFPRQAAGSLVEHNGRIVGSELIGQSFSAPGYFWGRPSADRAGQFVA